MKEKTNTFWMWWAVLSKALEVASLFGFHYAFHMGWFRSIIATIILSCVLMVLGWTVAKKDSQHGRHRWGGQSNGEE